MQVWFSKIKTLDDRFIYLFCGFLLLLKFILLPFTDIVDADAVSRIFIAQRWLDNPHLITNGVWAPLHHYLNAVIIFFTNSTITAPVIFQILFSVATILPLYFFTKRVFSPKGAIFTSIAYAFSPAVFRNSFMPLSETPYTFFVILSAVLLVKAVQDKELKCYIYAGISITIASGLRYESWILIALFTGILLLKKQVKGMILFWIFAMIFPAFWMVVGHLYHGDFLFGVSGAYEWNVELLGVNENVNSIELVKRYIFFPLSVFIHFNPIITLLTLGTLFFFIKNKRFTKDHLIWSLPFIFLLISFIIKAENGTLLLQHRFTISLILFIAPFFSLLFELNNSSWRNYLVGFSLITAIPFSFYINRPNYFKWIPSETISLAIKDIQLDTNNDMEAIPFFKNNEVHKIKDEIAKNIQENSGLILDFTGWDNTFFWALHANLHPRQIFIHSGAKNASFDTLGLKNLITNYPQGIVLIGCVTNHSDYYIMENNMLIIPALNNQNLFIEPLFCTEGWTLFSYKKELTNTLSITDKKCNCPIKGSKEYILLEIKQDLHWYNDVIRKARQNNVSVEKMLELDAQYILDHQ